MWAVYLFLGKGDAERREMVFFQLLNQASDLCVDEKAMEVAFSLLGRR